MFAVGIDLLTGRYCASRHNDRTAPEWPPHPLRLYAAMVAAWADADEPDPTEADALRWYEALGAPAISCSGASERQPVVAFVPVNDAAVAADRSTLYRKQADALAAIRAADEAGDPKAAAKAVKALDAATTKAKAGSASAVATKPAESADTARAALGVLPDLRGRQARVHPVAIPDDPHVELSWPDAQPDQSTSDVLDEVLRRVHRIGHSSTFVSCRVVDEPAPPRLVPDPAGDTPIRVTGPGLLSELQRTHAASRSGTEPRVLPYRPATYRSLDGHRPATLSSAFGQRWIVLRVDGRRNLPLRRVAEVSAAVRHALMHHAADPPPPLITGHQRAADGSGARTGPLQRPHLAIVPLPFVGTIHGNGAILGVALIVPPNSADDEVAQLHHALTAWAADSGDGTLPLLLAGGHRVPLQVDDTPDIATLQPNRWCRASVAWATVTPIALDRHPGDLRHRDPRRRRRAEDAACATVAAACHHVGLPQPAGITVDVDAVIAGSVRATAMPPFHSGSGPQRALVHARITFAEPVAGPVVLGAGRYRGMGLCLPVASRPAGSRTAGPRTAGPWTAEP